jgi:hypothetical protein
MNRIILNCRELLQLLHELGMVATAQRDVTDDVRLAASEITAGAGVQ